TFICRSNSLSNQLTYNRLYLRWCYMWCRASCNHCSPIQFSVIACTKFESQVLNQIQFLRCRLIAVSLFFYVPSSCRLSPKSINLLAGLHFCRQLSGRRRLDSSDPSIAYLLIEVVRFVPCLADRCGIQLHPWDHAWRHGHFPHEL